MGMRELIKGSVRQIVKAPGHALVVALMVALGVGATVTGFSLVDGVLLTPMPYPQADRIVSVSENNPGIRISVGWTSIPNFLDWHERADAFESMAVFSGRSASVGTEGDPEYAYGAAVSAEFFDVFGVQPAFGRAFTVEETRNEGDPVVILSHGLWTRGYGSDPRILGRSVSIDGRPHTVVGVMPEGFNAPGEWMGAGVRMSLWRPYGLGTDDQRGNRSSNAVARLADGVTLAAARTELASVHDQLRQAFPDANQDWEAQVFEWEGLIVGQVRPRLYLLLGAMVLLMITACANVASLTATRILRRGRELATRAALGASRSTIVSQVLAEVALVVGLGGVGGVLGARSGLAAIKALEPGLIPRLDSVDLDGSVLLFALAATALVAASVGGVAAVLSTGRNPSAGLRESRIGPSAGGRRIRSALTVAQFVMSFALLAGATLLSTSFRNMHRTELGFDTEGVTAMTVALSWDRVTTLEERTAFTRDVLREMERSPGVESAAMINSLPLSGTRSFRPVFIEGRTEEGREPAMAIRGVSAGYHATMGIPLIRGRAFESADIDGASTALLNETAVRLHWPVGDPIGERIRLGPSGPWLTVVGVTGDVLHDGPTGETLPEVYVPYSLETLDAKSFVARGSADRAALNAALRDALRRVDAGQPVREIRSMGEWVAHRLAPIRFQAMLMSGVALMATILAGFGLFATLGSLVRERGREIAIRMSLGAHKNGVLRLVVRRASILVIPGLGGGLLLALALGGMMQSLLFGVEPQSPLVLSLVAGGLLLVATLAVYLPAKRAASVDPARVLRDD